MAAKTFVMLSAVLLLTACGNQPADSPYAEGKLYRVDGSVYDAWGQSDNLPTHEITEENIREIIFGWTHLHQLGAEAFAPILNAYAQLELSSFAIADQYLIGHSIFAHGINPFGFPEESWLAYALHDINSDGMPELFIGLGWREFYTLTGVYTLQAGEPVSVTQLTSRRSYLQLQIDRYGGYVIEHSHGHMDWGTHAFFALDISGEFITLDILHTSGIHWGEGEWIGLDWVGDEPFYIRTRVVDGEDVRITEEEYIALIKKYGSRSYAIAIEENIVARNVNLEWWPILP